MLLAPIAPLAIESKLESQPSDSKESKHRHEARSLEKLLELQKQLEAKERNQVANIRKCFKHWKYKTRNSFNKKAVFALFYSKDFLKDPEQTIEVFLKRGEKYKDPVRYQRLYTHEKTEVDGIHAFMKENPKRLNLKVEFIKILIIMGTDYLPPFSAFYRNHYAQLLTKFSEEDRFELAKVDVAYHGTLALKKYNFSAAQLQSLETRAKDAVKNYVIHVPDEMIDNYVKTDNIDGLRYLMFQRFCGKFHNVLFNDCSVTNKLHKLQNSCTSSGAIARAFRQVAQQEPSLISELHKAQEKFVAELSEVAILFKQAMQQQEDFLLEHGWRKMPRQTHARRDHWGKNFGKKPDEEFNISHGGGYFNILEFLAGSHDGYPLEPNPFYLASGLQVSPNVSFPGGHRDELYANSRVTNPNKCYFDNPARLFGAIKAKYLDRAEDSHDYEAGLRPEFIDHLHDVRVSKF